MNPSLRVPVADVKQEAAQTSLLYGAVDDEFQASRPPWSQVVRASSPTSCVTSLSNNNLLNFSGTKAERRNQHLENSSEVFIHKFWRERVFLFFYIFFSRGCFLLVA